MSSVDPGNCSTSSNGETAFICINCGKVFNNMIRLKAHQKCHDNDVPSEASPTPDPINEIEEKSVFNVSSGIETFACNECGKEFNDNLVLQIHHQTQHGLIQQQHRKSVNFDADKKTDCDNDKKKPKVKKEIRKDHICTVCSQPFEKRSYLLLHMRLHTGERPYKCSVCSKDFRLIGHITTHMTTHIKERPYECSVCDKKFARSDYMKKHMKIHTGERPYACSLCQKAFTLKGNLERHMISHTKEKRHCCTVCDEKFSWEKTLLTHMKKLHGVENLSEIKKEKGPS